MPGARPITSWKAASASTRSSARSPAACIRSSSRRSASITSSSARSAASAAASGSSIRRTSNSSSTVRPRRRCVAKSVGSSSSSGSRLLTYVPSPWRTSSTRASESAAHRLAERVARQSELPGEVGLPRQACPGAPFAGGDQLADRLDRVVGDAAAAAAVAVPRRSRSLIAPFILCLCGKRSESKRPYRGDRFDRYRADTLTNIRSFRRNIPACRPGSSSAITYDVRFPTSRTGAGSDAMNPDPDYSAAYVALETDDPAGLTGHGLTFTIGRGTEVCVAAIEALAPHVVGATVEELIARPRRILAAPRHRHAAALARAGEGRDPSGDRGDRERRLGSVREARGEAALEAARRPVARADRRRASTSATSTTRSRPTRRSRSSAATSATKAEREQRSASPRASPRTRPRPAGSATRRRRSPSGRARRVAAGFTT